MSSVQYTTSTSGFSVGASSFDPVRTPAGLLVTRAVETKAGWIGQIIIDKTIIWEGSIWDASRHDAQTKAIQEANARVIDRLVKLFK